MGPPPVGLVDSVVVIWSGLVWSGRVWPPCLLASSHPCPPVPSVNPEDTAATTAMLHPSMSVKRPSIFDSDEAGRHHEGQLLTISEHRALDEAILDADGSSAADAERGSLRRSSTSGVASLDSDTLPPPPPPPAPRRMESSIHHKEGRRDYDFLLDKPEDMTYGRRMALWLIKYSWYNPSVQLPKENYAQSPAAVRHRKRYNRSGTARSAESIVSADASGDDAMADIYSTDCGDEDLIFQGGASTVLGETTDGTGGLNAQSDSGNSAVLMVRNRRRSANYPAGNNLLPNNTHHSGTMPNGTSDELQRTSSGSNQPRQLRQPQQQKHKPRKPSLVKAWAYFEHVTLPRYIYEPKRRKRKSLWQRFIRRVFLKGSQQLERATPGEMHRPTKLYSPLFTPISQMGDFGLGVGLHFTTLRAMTMVTFLLGLINIPSMWYYSSQEYSDGQEGVPYFLQGSAICTRTRWVPCPTCNSTQFSRHMDRLANTTKFTNGREQTLMFVLQNQCDGATFQLARVNFATIVFLVVGLIALQAYQIRAEQQFDEDEETAQDYSVVVKNPPADALDPDEWRDYFQNTFHARVAVVTIGMDNDLLVKTLVERREVLRKLELQLEPGAPLDVLSLARLATSIERKRNALQRLTALLMPGVPELFGKLVVLTSKVQGLAQQKFDVRNVFVSFEREKTRIRILNEFALGTMVYWGFLKHKVANKPHLRFRGRLLMIGQPDEPSTIRWQDLNARLRVRLTQMAVTTIVSMGVIALIFWLISLAYEIDDFTGAVTIAVFNIAYPQVAKILTEFESHFSEGDKQTSLYFKIGFFRWITTAIIITIITVSVPHLVGLHLPKWGLAVHQ